MPAISLLGTDYATLDAWWTAERTNDYSGAGPILEVPAGLGAMLAANLQFRYGTASKYTIRSVSGDECVGDVSTPSAIATLDCGGFELDFRNDNINFEDIHLTNWTIDNTGDTWINPKFERCVVQGYMDLEQSTVPTGFQGIDSVFVLPASDPSTQTQRVFHTRYANNMSLLRCTLINKAGGTSDAAIWNRSSLAISINQTVVYSATNNTYGTADAPATPTTANNAASDATLPGAVETSITSAVFENFATGDYRLKSDSSPALMGTPAGAFIQVVAQADPVLDTPQADLVFQVGTSGTTDVSGNFSDVNTGDTLTYTISPAMTNGFSFNTATGVITHTSIPSIASVIAYTVTCSDGQGGSPAIDTFNITVVSAVFTIDTLSSATPEAGSTISIEYRNAGVAPTGSTTAGALNKVSDDGSTAVFDVPVPPLFGDLTLNYEAALNITFSDGTDTDIQAITIQVPSAEEFAQIDTIDADGIYANDTGVTTTMFAHAKDITGDMVIDLTDGLVTANPSITSSFNYAIYDGTEWGSYAAVSFGAETVKPVITLNGSANLVWVQGVAWVDPGATVTDNVDATRQITSSSAPNVNAVGPYSLPYNAIDAAGNVGDTVYRLVTVSSADSTPNPINFVDVANAELSTVYENVQQILGVDAGQTLTATGNLTVSNDGGVTWSTSVQMVTGQTYVKATVTSSAVNEDPVNSTGSVNGITDTFTVTTKALITRTFSIGSSDPVVDSAGDNVTHTFPIWELWDKIPEDETAVKIDSGINFAVANGIGSIQTSSAQLSTTYIFVARDSGNSPANYIRTAGQVT